METINNYTFSLDGYAKSNLDCFMQEAIPNKWDGLFIIFGGEGGGKSTLASQWALYLDHKFNLDYVVFTPEQFNKAIDTCKPESSIVFDEAITAANAAAHATEMQQSIISKMTQIRHKKLKIFFCFPYLNMLRRYFLDRCLFGIYIYAKDFNKRGFGYFYNCPQLASLHYLMKNKYLFEPHKAIRKANKSFFFNFSKTLCLPEDAYEEKKSKSRVELAKKGNDNIWRAKCADLIQFVMTKGVTQQMIADRWDTTSQYVSGLKKYLIKPNNPINQV